VDLVILPQDRVISDAFRSRLFSRTSLVVDGPTNLIVRLQNGVQLDIFIARHESRDLLNTTPSNFGSLFLLRTGSKEHNIYIIERAKELGLTWKTHEGIIGPDGAILAAATEAEILKALKLDWIPPESRER
jgi:DNA polymerase (family 10)